MPDRKLAANATWTTEPIKTRGVFTLYCTLHGGMKALVTTTGSFTVTDTMKAAAAGASPPEVATGEKLFSERAQCFRCHGIGKEGTADYGPNLEDIGLRAQSRARDRGLDNAAAYLVEAIQRPAAYVVPGFADDMPALSGPPVNLNGQEIKALVAYLESQGGKVDLWEIEVPETSPEITHPVGLPVTERDPEAGKKIFFEEAGCTACHRVGTRAGGLGPELTHIGAYRDEAFFLREILEPSAVVPTGYRTINLRLKEKKSVFGVLRHESADAYTVKTGDRSERRIAKSEVVHADIGKQSLMPNFRSLTVQQLADLVSYLQTLR